MHLKNEEETQETIQQWRGYSLEAQLIRLNKAIEATELDLMYYEQKNSKRGIERCSACLALLQGRIGELKKD